MRKPEPFTRKPPEVARKPGAGKPVAGGKAGPARRPLPAFEKVDDPIDESTFPGDLEGDARAEVDQVRHAFAEAREKEKAHFARQTEAGYYFVAVFEDEPQCDAFFKAVKLSRQGDLFVDGRILADLLGVELPASDMRYVEPRKSKRMLGLVRKREGERS